MIAQRVRGSSLWTPAKIATAVWLDASDSASLTTVSNRVSEWRDKSGNARHATQTNDSYRPTYSASAFNGKPGLSFDGVDDYLVTPATISGADFTLAAAYAPTEIAIASSEGDAIASLSAAGVEANGYFHLIYRSDITNKLRWLTTTNGSDGGLSTAYLSATATTAPVIATAWRSPTETALALNGEVQSNASDMEGGGSAVYANARVGVGTYFYAPLNYSGNIKIGEILVLIGAASLMTRQRLEGYLAHKWGLTANLPAAHPYKVAPPRS